MSNPSSIAPASGFVSFFRADGTTRIALNVANIAALHVVSEDVTRITMTVTTTNYDVRGSFDQVLEACRSSLVVHDEER